MEYHQFNKIGITRSTLQVMSSDMKLKPTYTNNIPLSSMLFCIPTEASHFMFSSPKPIGSSLVVLQLGIKKLVSKDMHRMYNYGVQLQSTMRTIRSTSIATFCNYIPFAYLWQISLEWWYSMCHFQTCGLNSKSDI